MQQSPCHDSNGQGLERIPEYSEDIYPYATFHLPDQENLSGNPMSRNQNNSLIYDTRDMMVGSKQQIRSNSNSNSNSNTGTIKRMRRKSKSFKSESEEYDSLGSDTDTGSAENCGVSSRTESANNLIDGSVGGSLNYTSHAHSPGPRHGKERLALLPTRPTHHSKLVLFF